MRSVNDDAVQFKDDKEIVDYTITNPPTSDHAAYAISTYLENKGVL